MRKQSHAQHWTARLQPLRQRLGQSASQGQALVEYVLILVLIVLAIVVAMVATGPAIGNVFSNTVYGIIGGDGPTITPANPTQFWETVTAVASFTPDAYIPPTNTSVAPTSTWTPMTPDTPTPITPTNTPTSTVTPGPSPTPPDIIHDAPYYDDITTADWWRIDPNSVYMGSDPWTVEYFSGYYRYDTGPIADPADCTATNALEGQAFDFSFGYGGPDLGITWDDCDPSSDADTFALRFTREISFEANTTLQVSVGSDDGSRVYVDDTLLPHNNWRNQGHHVETVEFTFPAGLHTLRVEMYEDGGGASVEFSAELASDDEGACDWTMSNDYPYSSPTGWSDSPNSYYYSNSLCHIALRGAVNLATLSDPPVMRWWHAYDLDDIDKAWIQVREYDETVLSRENPDAWYAFEVLSGFIEERTYTRYELDLTAYDGYDTNTGTLVENIDWTGQTIEFRFVLEADSSNTEEGWWIDDLEIEGNVLNIFPFGFADDMENGPGNWLPGGTWALSNEHVRSTSNAWSDSPGSYYSSNRNASLELDGVLDLTGGGSTDPELVFYSSYYLHNTDMIFVEASLDGETWNTLTPERDNGALVTGSARNDAFVREAVSLAAYNGEYVYLRFRIETDNSSQRDGWWIDDVLTQNRPSGYSPFPFYDDMEGGPGYWVADGYWAISPEEAHSGFNAWSDSPGTDYPDDSDTTLTIARPFLISGDVSNVELSFFQMHDVRRWDNVYVEISPDATADSWTEVWSYVYTEDGSEHPEAPGNQYNDFNEQYGWRYESVNLSDYITADVEFYLRFRMYALLDGADDNGVWIDDVRLAYHTQNPHSLPFTDDMESGNNWRAGGDWALDDETAHSGTYAWSDSPPEDQDYRDDSWNELELIEPVDLTGLISGDFPVLTWWDRFDLDRYDYGRVQVSRYVGPNWDDWSLWEQVESHYYTENEAWTYRRADLRPYIGDLIRVRFVLDALEDYRTDPGWWIDDVSVELYDPTVFSMDFFDPADLLNNWNPEGTWGLGDAFRDTGGSGGFGPGAWTATFYDLTEYNWCGSASSRADDAITGDDFWCGGQQRIFNAQYVVDLAAVDYDCSSSEIPHPDGTCASTTWKTTGWDHDMIAIQFERTVTVSEAGYYQFTIWSDDGVRLYIDDDRVLSKWYDQSAYSPWVTTEYLDAGQHDIEVRWYEQGGDAVIQLDVAEVGRSFHDSPDDDDDPDTDVDYEDDSNTSLTLDGVVDMTGSNNPVLSWYEFYDMDYLDCRIVELSVPFESGEFGNWIEIYQSCQDRRDDWTLRAIPIREPLENALGYSPGTLDFTDLMLTFRFRLDARTGYQTDPGWWIDDITLAD